MAASTEDRDHDDSGPGVFFVSRRELAVLAIALSMVLCSILLLVVTSSRLTIALLGPG